MKSEKIIRSAIASMRRLGIAACRAPVAPSDCEKYFGIDKGDENDRATSKERVRIVRSRHAAPTGQLPTSWCDKRIERGTVAGPMERSAACRQVPPQRLAAENEPPLGAHLVTQRRGYSHHGIYVGSGHVVHYAGLCSGTHAGPVEELSLEHFAAGHGIEVRAEPRPHYSGDEAIRRARSRLGENRYRLLSNNCEHFCTWCLYGEARSEQVRQCAVHPMCALRALGGLLSVWWGCRRARVLLAAY